MEEGSPDIVAKYQKLATEYSKLRAQVTVLKKAISEEKDRNAELKEALKEKDQSVRKLEQEVECLNFRNLQLTKRVSVLQTDLETVEEEKNKKTKNKSSQNVTSSSTPSSSSSDAQRVFNSELLSRIEENEKLHQKVFESEIQHKKATSELTAKLESLELQLAQQQSSYGDTIKKNEETIAKLSQERAKYELRLKNFEKDIKDVKSKDEISKHQLEFVRKDLGTKLEEVSRIVQEKVYFNDTRQMKLNDLNVPLLLNQQHKQFSKLVGDLKVIISDLVRRLSDLHTYMEQKVQSMELQNESGAALNRLAIILRDHTSYLKPIEKLFEDFVIKVQADSSAWLEMTSLRAIGTAFSKYVSYLQKLLPYILFSIEVEDSSKGTTPRLKEIYGKLSIVSQSLIVAFTKLDRYIELLVEVGCPNNNVHYHISRTVLMSKIVSSIISVHFQFEEARKVFGTKVLLDSDLPTSTEAVKATDECILSSMIAISGCLKKMSAVLEDKASILACEIPFKPRDIRMEKKFHISPCVPEFRERGVKYISILQWDDPPSIPYEIAIKNSQLLKSCEESRDSLVQKLQSCQNKLKKMELEKEHWMVECQLLKTKQYKVTTVGDDNNFPDSDETIQAFVKSNVNNLVSQIQFADSKAIVFQNECECLFMKLKLTEEKNDNLLREINGAKETINELQEEQRTLMKNYEDQLSTMSDHLATLNETLTSQKDEIDALKHAKSNKGSKKGKGK